VLLPWVLTLAFALPGAVNAGAFESPSVAVHPQATVAAGVEGIVRDELATAYDRSGPRDTRYYRTGEWRNWDRDCWTCDVAPATAASVLWATSGLTDTRMRSAVVATFDHAIREQQRADGLFRGANSSPGIQAAFFGVELGTTYLLVGDRVGAATRARWRASLERAADALIREGDTTWYANGNINILFAELLYDAWRATGRADLHRAFDTALEFTLHPSQRRWPGRGLILTREPLLASGADGAGYLSEEGSGGVGFDAEYTSMQLDAASRLWLFSRDPRVLRLANLLANELLVRVDSSWDLDTSGGTRHPQPNRRAPFLTGGIATLAWAGGRPELAADLPSQLARARDEYDETKAPKHHNDVRWLSTQLGTLLLAAQVAQTDGAPLGAPVRGS